MAQKDKSPDDTQNNSRTAVNEAAPNWANNHMDEHPWSPAGFAPQEKGKGQPGQEDWKNHTSANSRMPQGAHPYFSVNEIEPATIVYEDKNSLIIEIELPGVKEGEVFVQVLKNMVTIFGKKQSKNIKAGAPVLCSMRYWNGNFRQSVNLGFTLEDSKALKVKFSEGFLILEAPIPQSTKN